MHTQLHTLPVLRRRQSWEVDIAQETGPLDIIAGKRLLVVADAQNLDLSARDLGYRLSWAALRTALVRAASWSSCHAILSTAPDDPRRLEYLTDRGWIPHAKVVGHLPNARNGRRPNADFRLAFMAGLLASRAHVDAVILASGDGDLVEDVAEGILALRSSRSVITLSLAGSTSQRLNSEVSSLIAGNIEVGLDCLHPLYRA